MGQVEPHSHVLSGEWPLCECGCGKPTNPYKHSDRRRGQVKGEPMRYLHGHTGGRPPIDWNDLVETIHGCLIFASYTYPKQGYRRVRWNGAVVPAHRMIWEKAHGPIPDGYLIHHRCENKKCVNLAHLDLLGWGEHSSLHMAARKAA